MFGHAKSCGRLCLDLKAEKSIKTPALVRCMVKANYSSVYDGFPESSFVIVYLSMSVTEKTFSICLSVKVHRVLLLAILRSEVKDCLNAVNPAHIKPIFEFRRLYIAHFNC